MIKGLKSNRLGDIWDWFLDQIIPTYGVNEAKAIGYHLFELYFQKSQTCLLASKDQVFGESAIVSVHKAIVKLQMNMPVQYITGISYFRDLELCVTQDVLIPRPETEELVEWVLKETRQTLNHPKQELSFWDIGTGSGAIAISLAREIKNSIVYASDISSEALTIAAKNSTRLKSNVQFFKHNILADQSPPILIDCLVSNPPYVRESEKDLMKNNVLGYEPHLALFVPDNNPTKFYEVIAAKAKEVLKPEGLIYLEINESLGEETKEVFSKNGYKNIRLKNDIYNKTRFLNCQYIKE